MTTTASIIFQNSLRYEPGCKITPKSIICNMKYMTVCRQIIIQLNANLTFNIISIAKITVNTLSTTSKASFQSDWSLIGSSAANAILLNMMISIMKKSKYLKFTIQWAALRMLICEKCIYIYFVKSQLRIDFCYFSISQIIQYPLVGVSKNIDEYGSIGLGPSSSSSSSTLLSGSSMWCFRWCLISETLWIISLINIKNTHGHGYQMFYLEFCDGDVGIISILDGSVLICSASISFSSSCCCFCTVDEQH